MKRFLKEYKFIITVTLAIIGIIGLDALISFVTKSVQIIPSTNTFLSQYSGILLLVLISITLYIAYKQSFISKKLGMLTPETFTIVSDDKTIFVGSTTNRALPSDVKAIPAQIHDFWKQADDKFPALKSATWIADRKQITNNEAIHGGQYTFVREFEFPFESSHIRTAEISLLVDDSCELIVNEIRFEKVCGFDNLHRIDIAKAVKQGKNRVQFIVENQCVEEWNDPNANKGFYESKEKYLWNPYGFKFCITIKYFR